MYWWYESLSENITDAGNHYKYTALYFEYFTIFSKDIIGIWRGLNIYFPLKEAVEIYFYMGGDLVTA